MDDKGHQMRDLGKMYSLNIWQEDRKYENNYVIGNTF